eukprot:112262-Pyramimonas_sp.AAC.1
MRALTTRLVVRRGAPTWARRTLSLGLYPWGTIRVGGAPQCAWGLNATIVSRALNADPCGPRSAWEAFRSRRGSGMRTLSLGP